MSKIIVYLFFLVSLLTQDIYGQEKDKIDQTRNGNNLVYNGLTKTLTDLIYLKPESCLSIGSYNIFIDKLIDNNIAEALNCDSEIDNYLNNSDDELYYEMLSDIMEDSIQQKFEGDYNWLYVTVDASENDYNMQISIYLYLEKNVIIPILIETINNKFRSSFDINCKAKLQFYGDLFIDSNEVNNGEMLQGIKFKLNTFFIEITSYDENNDDNFSQNTEVNTVPVLRCNGLFYESIITSAELFASLNWYLSSSNIHLSEDDDDYNIISYEDIYNGDYKWDLFGDSQFDFNLTAQKNKSNIMLEDENTDIEIQYHAEDLFSDTRIEQLNIYDNEWINIGIPTIRSQFTIK